MMFEKMFGKKACRAVEVINFSGANVATGQVGSYIKKLYEEEGFSHMGYRYENKEGELRFIIYTLPNAKKVIHYFKDRCPAMVEAECQKQKPIPYKWNKLENGFEEISTD